MVGFTSSNCRWEACTSTMTILFIWTLQVVAAPSGSNFPTSRSSCHLDCKIWTMMECLVLMMNANMYAFVFCKGPVFYSICVAYACHLVQNSFSFIPHIGGHLHRSGWHAHEQNPSGICRWIRRSCHGRALLWGVWPSLRKGNAHICCLP